MGIIKYTTIRIETIGGVNPGFGGDCEEGVILNDKWNFRSLGGYKTTDGTKKMKSNMIFRGKDPDDCKGMPEELNKLGIGAILNLRGGYGSEPRSYSKPSWAQKYGMEFHNEALSITMDHDKCISVISNWVAKGLKVFVHCHMGKDRTGEVITKLLRYLSICKEDIYREDHKTYESIRASAHLHDGSGNPKKKDVSPLGGTLANKLRGNLLVEPSSYSNSAGGLRGTDNGTGDFSHLTNRAELKKVLQNTNYINTSTGQYKIISKWGYGYKDGQLVKLSGKCTAGPTTFYRNAGISLHFWATGGVSGATGVTDVRDMSGQGFGLVWQGSLAQWDKVSSNDTVMPSFLEPGDVCTLHGYHSDGTATSHGAMWTGQDWRSDAIDTRLWCYRRGRPREPFPVNIFRYKYTGRVLSNN